MSRLPDAALARFALDPSSPPELVREGENTTYRVRTARGDVAVRIGRPGYHTVAAVRSELAWMRALDEDGIATPRPVPGRDGDPVQEVRGDDGIVRTVVAFEWVDGRPLPEVRGLDAWRRLGATMAHVHAHGRRWTKPAGFVRPAWDLDALVGDTPRWGTPLPPEVWPPEAAAALRAAREAVRERLAAVGTQADRYGLIHADLGFENVLVTADGEAVLIDFDDCGPSWYLYELASVLYPFDGEPGMRERLGELVAGYRSVAPLGDDELAELPTFLMARRLATLGWTFSRGETPHARRQRPRRLSTSPAAARAFLEWHRANRR